MVMAIVPGQTSWGMTVDEENYRFYDISFLVQGSKTDGPYNALRTLGLPRNGDFWSFLSDVDTWAFCTPYRKITQRATSGPNTQFTVDFKFTNKPLKRCQDVQIDNPLLEPMRISGSYVKYLEEGITDRFGHLILSSSWERFRGQQNEWDANRPQVIIQQNINFLQLELFTWMVDTLNDRDLWGLRPRCIKLSSVTWEEKYWGQCFKYYTRTFTFDINSKTFDRELVDEGTKALSGHWTAKRHWLIDKIDGEYPDRFNPAHFVTLTDYHGTPINGVLNGKGLPAGCCIDDPDPFVPADTTIYYVNWAGSAGAFPGDRRFWIKRVGAYTAPELAGNATAWANDKVYKVAELVKRGGRTYIARSPNLGQDPLILPADAWIILPVVPLVDKGMFGPLEVYDVGDFIRTSTIVSGPGTGSPATCTPTQIGMIPVQKYLQGNLLLLGIPPIIGH